MEGLNHIQQSHVRRSTRYRTFTNVIIAYNALSAFKCKRSLWESFYGNVVIAALDIRTRRKAQFYFVSTLVVIPFYTRGYMTADSTVKTDLTYALEV